MLIRTDEADTFLVFSIACPFDLFDVANHHLHGVSQDRPYTLCQCKNVYRCGGVCGHVSDLNPVKIGLYDLKLFERYKLTESERA